MQRGVSAFGFSSRYRDSDGSESSKKFFPLKVIPESRNPEKTCFEKFSTSTDTLAAPFLFDPKKENPPSLITCKRLLWGRTSVGQDVSGARSCGAELRGAGRHWGNIPGAERRGAGG